MTQSYTTSFLNGETTHFSDFKMKSTEFTCRICEKLHESYDDPPVKAYEDIEHDIKTDCKPHPIWT